MSSKEYGQRARCWCDPRSLLERVSSQSCVPADAARCDPLSVRPKWAAPHHQMALPAECMQFQVPALVQAMQAQTQSEGPPGAALRWPPKGSSGHGSEAPLGISNGTGKDALARSRPHHQTLARTFSRTPSPPSRGVQFSPAADAKPSSLGSLMCFQLGVCSPCGFLRTTRGCILAGECRWCHDHRQANPSQKKRINQRRQERARTAALVRSGPPGVF